MSYSVEHVRYTLECDCCGHTEKRDLDAYPDQVELGTKGWCSVQVLNRSTHFCCPTCVEKLNAILHHRVREAEAAHAAAVAACIHDYQQRGFFLQCTKCEEFKR